MEKLQTPMVAGMGGAAILAALFSFGGERKNHAGALDARYEHLLQDRRGRQERVA